VREARIFALPASVRGPVLGPPCIRQRPLGIAAARHGAPDRVLAPQRGALPGLPVRFPLLSRPIPSSAEWNRGTSANQTVVSVDYESHYNTKLGKCLVLLSRTSSVTFGDDATFSITVPYP
jgi:hypothetical protein